MMFSAYGIPQPTPLARTCVHGHHASIVLTRDLVPCARRHGTPRHFQVVARIQERHTWPGIRRSVGRYVGQCLTCQQVRDKPGDVRFHLKNIQGGYFNELVQYDHPKICPSDNNNTGILVIIDHFTKFAEAVPCSHHDYDAVTTSRLLLQKWFARHGTPTRMQSDNAPNLTAEVSNEFLKAAPVTKVISTAGHPRTQGLVERQNRTLLTLLRVFCSRRMRDWDQCLDGVMGAYNSTRHATTGFSPYMLTRGVSRFCTPNLPPNPSKRMKRTSITCWLANKRFMTWCDVTHTKPNYVKN